MFEDVTYEALVKRVLARVPNSIDKREGSVIYDAVAPACAELAQAYIELDVVIREAFADTASRAYLCLRAGERGLVPETATYAQAKGEFNVDVGVGTRFSLDKYNYITTEFVGIDEESGYYIYLMECETEGTEPNGHTGTMTPVTYITGLSYCVLTEITKPGEDEEDTEVFRQRYFDSLNSQAFGGNIADYKQKVHSIEGVGGVRVYRADEWNGGGTVKLVIQNSSFEVPSEELVQEVQTEIDPYMTDGLLTTGTGVGLAPIGHQVTVVGANKLEINIAAKFVMIDGYTFEGQKSNIEIAIKDYFYSLNEAWEDTSIAVVVAQIITRVMAVTGVADVADVKLNGNSSNLSVPTDRVIVLGEVSDEND
jgi:uncharacterized phage protein gp47/JayE